MLQYLTLTGADSRTSIESLRYLTKKFPLIEWGILWSEKSAGTPRYPSLEWVQELVKYRDDFATLTGQPRFSLHICGRIAIEHFLQGKPLFGREDLSAFFHRVQLNFRSQDWDIKPQEIEAVCSFHPRLKIVTQYNEQNRILCENVKASNHQILFDSSLGEGKIATMWPAPLPKVLCGYAGGIGTAAMGHKDHLWTLLQHFETITTGRNYWVDMESSLRNHHMNFDLNTCEKVATTAMEHVIQQLYRLKESDR